MRSDPSTWVDRHGAKRTVPMKVLVLGFCRTGTASMRVALETLGYRETHHMFPVLMNPPEVDMWMEAHDAKFEGKGKPFGVAEWDQLLGHCQAVTDFPAILFAEELIAAYPDAKVILTTRDPAKWWVSFRDSIQWMYHSSQVDRARELDPGHFGKVIGFTETCVKGMLGAAGGAREPESTKRYLEYYDRIRALVPKEQLMECEISEGWAPVCSFLGHDIPDMEFPRTNETKTFQEEIGGWSRAIIDAHK